MWSIMSHIKLLIFIITTTTCTYSLRAPLDISKLRIFGWNVFAESPVLPSDLSFHYYNQQNKDSSIIFNLGEFSGHITNDFDPTLPTYFISHGSGDSYTSTITLKNHILDQQNANVFLIDWSKQSALFYTQAVTCVPKMGLIMGEAIEKIRNQHNLPYSNINLIGHSLGAHVVGSIGAYLQGNANYILALDAAGPLFTNRPADKRLDVTDAQFVQVLHTNGGFQGIRESIGHANYFPNGGGMNQVGCGTDLFGVCAHARANDIYKESLKSGGFAARSCGSYTDFKKGLCDGNEKSYFGEIFIDTRARGNYYFDTNSKSPFATGKC